MNREWIDIDDDPANHGGVRSYDPDTADRRWYSEPSWTALDVTVLAVMVLLQLAVGAWLLYTAL